METLWLGTALHFKLHRTKNCLIRSTTLDGNFEVVTVQVHTETFCYGTEICNAQEGNIGNLLVYYLVSIRMILRKVIMHYKRRQRCIEQEQEHI